MKLERLIISGFQSFGPEPTTIELESRTFFLGPNGSGKTAVLQALVRLFGFTPELRRVLVSDFHQPAIPNDDGTLSLVLEAHFSFDELLDDELHPSVAPSFRHMALQDPEASPQLRVRLTAILDADGEIDETIVYITSVDENGDAAKFSQMPRSDRSLFQVHYLPARRDPSGQIRYSASSLIGRVLKSASWSSQLEQVESLSNQLSELLGTNAGVGGLDEQLEAQWSAVHTGDFFASPKVSFDTSELDGLLRHLTINFGPAPTSPTASFERLSDGQQSLLYIALVLAVQALGRRALAGELPEIDATKLRPPIFVLVAVEEPENSLSPHHLGRVLTQLSGFSTDESAQVVFATHSPAVLRRVPPEEVRHLRLDSSRHSKVSRIAMPADDVDAAKFLREAVQSYPELYFSRLVVLGEGDSEELVLPRLLAAHSLVTDHVSVSVVPLGGRHVHHFWRLLESIGIPYVTLLDLDAGRHDGGWGRLRYAIKQCRDHRGDDPVDTERALSSLSPWDAPTRPDQDLATKGPELMTRLEERDVFFSSPIDLDFAMLSAYPSAYGVEEDERQEPDDRTITAVFGKSPGPVDSLYTADEQQLFDAYRTRFTTSSKPANHLAALARLDDTAVRSSLHPAYERLIQRVAKKLEELPE